MLRKRASLAEQIGAAGTITALSFVSGYLKAKYLLPTSDDITKICESSSSNNTKEESESIRGQVASCCQNGSSNDKANNYEHSAQTGISPCIITTSNKFKNQSLNNIRKLFQIFLNCLPQFWIIRPTRFHFIIGLGLRHDIISYKNLSKCKSVQDISQHRCSK